MKQTYLLLLLLSVMACSNMDDYKTKRVKCCAYPSAPLGYESILVSGCRLGHTIVPNGHILGQGWAKCPYGFGLGDGRGTAPDTAYIIYYSITEDQFYVGIQPLDQKKLYEMLTARYKTIEKNSKECGFSSFMVGVAPGGTITIWIQGAERREVCSFKAFPVNDLDYKGALGYNEPRENFLKNSIKEMYPFVQREIAENRLPFSYWDDIRIKHPWKLQFSDPGFSLYDYGIEFINMEAYSMAVSPQELDTISLKPIPNKISLYMKHDKDPVRYNIECEFWDYDDKLEVSQDAWNQMTCYRRLMQVYKEFYEQASGEEVSLYFDLSDDMKSAKLKLKTATKEKELEGCKISIYDSETYKIDF